MRKEWILPVLAAAVIAVAGWFWTPTAAQTVAPSLTQFNASTDVGTSGYTALALDASGETFVRGIGSATAVNVEVCADTNGMAGFVMYLMDHPSGEAYNYLADTDFDTTSQNLTFVTTLGPHEVNSNGCAHFHAHIGAAWAVGFGATVELEDAVTSGLVTIRGSLRAE